MPTLRSQSIRTGPRWPFQEGPLAGGDSLVTAEESAPQLAPLTSFSSLRVHLDELFLWSLEPTPAPLRTP